MLLGGAGLLGACSNLIGLSDYKVDPSLDPSAGGASTSDGGKSSLGGEPASAGEPGSAGDPGQPVGGSNSGGTNAAGGESGAGNGPAECTSSADCDDTIDCTQDACDADGKCTHTLNDLVCDSTRCEVCQAGIGCVAREKTEMQMLVDQNFDDNSADWDQTSDTFKQNIFTDPKAETPMMLARFGPAAANATEAEYADLLQYVTIPETIAALTLKGYYKVLPGTQHTAEEDYVVAGLWDLDGSIKPFAQFHSFHANDGAVPEWKAFSYSLSAKQIKQIAGNEYSFDLVANAWDSVYQFDTLELNATICK